MFFLIPLLAQQMQFGRENPNDGPYILWQKDTAEIIYFVNNEVYSKFLPSHELADGELIIEELDFQQKIFKNHTVSQSEYDDVEKFFALSDIHGQYDIFVQILQNNNIIDSAKNWIWDNGHLIILGDVLDRGSQVTECLWLIYRLLEQAESSGGAVHFLLGNHELMILQNRLHYVNEKYIEQAAKMNRSFAEFWQIDSEFGKWLRSLNTVIRVDDALFVHAGIHPKIAVRNLSIDSLNYLVRQNIDSNIKDEDDFLKMIFGNIGPFWYRGYVHPMDMYEKITEQELDQILSFFNVSKIIIGHNTLERISYFYDRKIIGIDGGQKYGDRGEGLLKQAGKYFRCDARGNMMEISSYK
jgi:hypothetical protein